MKQISGNMLSNIKSNFLKDFTIYEQYKDASNSVTMIRFVKVAKPVENKKTNKSILVFITAIVLE